MISSLCPHCSQRLVLHLNLIFTKSMSTFGSTDPSSSTQSFYSPLKLMCWEKPIYGCAIESSGWWESEQPSCDASHAFLIVSLSCNNHCCSSQLNKRKYKLINTFEYDKERLPPRMLWLLTCWLVGCNFISSQKGAPLNSIFNMRSFAKWDQFTFLRAGFDNAITPRP